MVVELPLPTRPTRTLRALAALRRSVRRLFVADGAVSLAFGACGAVAVSFVVDYFLDLPVAVRLLFLLAAAAAFLYHAGVYVAAWLFRRISDEDLANLVEHSNPELHQSLITAVQLSRPGNEAAAYVSPSLLARVIEAAEERASRFDFRRVEAVRRLYAKTLLAAGALGVLVAAAVLDPVLGGIWLRRNVLLRAESWPKTTELELLSPRPPIVVAVGDPLEVAVRVNRGTPKSVVLRHSEDDGPERVDVLAETTSGIYRQIFAHVGKPMEFLVEGGDAVIGPYRVDVKLRPRINMQSIRIWCEYPPTTGLASTPLSEPVRHGNLKVPAGTRVRYRMSTNIPVRRVFLVLRTASEAGTGAAEPAEAAPAAGMPAGGEWPEPGAVPVEIKDGRVFQGEFAVKESGYYYFQCESEDLYRSYRPDRFRLDAIADRKPLVRIIEPREITEEVAPRATVRVRVSASDDYGIEKGSVDGLYFAAEVPGSPGREGGGPGVAPPGGKEGRGHVVSFPLPELAPAGGSEGGPEAPAASEAREAEVTIGVQGLAPAGGPAPAPGGRFQYLALVSDLGGNTGESQVHFLDIVSEDDLLRILSDHLMVVRDQLQEILRRQQSARKDLGDLRLRLEPSGRIEAKDGPRLLRHQQDQLRISQALERGVGDLERVLERSIRNNVGGAKWRNWVSGIRDDLRRLALGGSRRIEKDLEALRRKAQESSQELAALDLVQSAQGEVARQIDQLVLRLSEFGDMNALIQMLREVRRRQFELREETRSRVHGASEKESQP